MTRDSEAEDHRKGRGREGEKEGEQHRERNTQRGVWILSEGDVTRSAGTTEEDMDNRASHPLANDPGGEERFAFMTGRAQLLVEGGVKRSGLETVHWRVALWWMADGSNVRL